MTIERAITFHSPDGSGGGSGALRTPGRYFFDEGRVSCNVVRVLGGNPRQTETFSASPFRATITRPVKLWVDESGSLPGEPTYSLCETVDSATRTLGPGEASLEENVGDRGYLVYGVYEDGRLTSLEFEDKGFSGSIDQLAIDLRLARRITPNYSPFGAFYDLYKNLGVRAFNPDPLPAAAFQGFGVLRDNAARQEIVKRKLTALSVVERRVLNTTINRVLTAALKSRNDLDDDAEDVFFSEFRLRIIENLDLLKSPLIRFDDPSLLVPGLAQLIGEVAEVYVVAAGTEQFKAGMSTVRFDLEDVDKLENGVIVPVMLCNTELDEESANKTIVSLGVALRLEGSDYKLSVQGDYVVLSVVPNPVLEQPTLEYRVNIFVSEQAVIDALEEPTVAKYQGLAGKYMVVSAQTE